MFFKSRKKLQELNLQVYINDQQIEQVNETVFLGVVLDENLTWKAHISHVANKISKSIILEQYINLVLSFLKLVLRVCTIL